MALVLHYVYEQDNLFSGWTDDGGGGTTTFSWYDHDLASDPIPLYIVEPDFFVAEADTFYVTLPVTTEVTAGFFIDEDVFFVPMSITILKQSVQMLRNEIRRVR